ncbi:MAG: IPT/TIG domain-containing protein, partial [Bacteroidales bacterium]|nr:IPT/TIG domain-containing protein [Bacteroidales bacterium]
MRTKSLTAIAALFIATFYSCQSEKFTEKGIPEVNTLGVTILETGVIFHGQIITDAGLQITDHGFNWVPEGSNNPSDVQYYSLGPVTGETQFSVTVNSTIEKDKIYTVRAFISSDEKISFGNKVTFSGKGSKPPELLSLNPVSASIGDTVVIRGKYFSNNPESCSVYFGDVSASVLSSSTDELEVVVPFVNDPDVQVKVAVSGIFSANNLDFNILLPVLTAISPASAACGDTVVITGNYFSGNQANCSVFFSTRQGQVLSVTSTEIKAIVPYTPQLSFKVKAFFNGVPSVNTLDFDIQLPVLLGISPQSGTFGDIITLHGAYLPTDTTLFRVFFGDSRAVVTEVTRTQIKVIVPTASNISPATITLKYFYDFPFPEQFTLEQAVINDVSPSKLTEWMDVTIRGSNFNPNWRMVRVEIGGLNAAVISSTSSEIVVHLPSGLASGQHQVVVTIISGSPVTWDGYLELESAWIKMADFPPSGRMGASGFSLGGRIYFGTGIEPYLQYTSDFWEYDPGSG